MRSALLVVASVACFACGTEDSGPGVSITGHVGGKDLVAREGFFVESTENSGTLLMILISDHAATCSGLGSGTSYRNLSMLELNLVKDDGTPPDVGTYQVVDPGNLPAMPPRRFAAGIAIRTSSLCGLASERYAAEGIVEVTDVSASRAKGSFTIRFPDAPTEEVNGTFDVGSCDIPAGATAHRCED